MEEKYLEIIKKYDEMAFSRLPELAKAIAEMNREFVEWCIKDTLFNSKIKRYCVFDDYKVSFKTLDELFSYWYSEIYKQK